jgi:hypothetical protein
MEAIIDRFNQAGIRYLVMGGQAVRLAGLPRFSMDWDIYIPPRDIENITRINDLLGDELDVPVEPLGPKGEYFIQTYQIGASILQFHLGGPGLPDFEACEARAVVRTTENGTRVNSLSLQDLMESKRCAGRAIDQSDIEYLEALQRNSQR